MKAPFALSHSAVNGWLIDRGLLDIRNGGTIGLVVETASPEAMERAAVDGGVVVREVVPGSPAAQAGVLGEFMGDGFDVTKAAEAVDRGLYRQRVP